MNSAIRIGLGSIFLVSALQPAFATDASLSKLKHETELEVSFGGIPIGSAKFKLEYDGRTYRLEGKGKTGGLADVVSPGKGNFTSIGEIKGDRVDVKNHALRAEEIRKEKKSVVNMAFKNGEVVLRKVTPDKLTRRNRSSKYVHVTPEHMQRVIDPASSLVVPVATEHRGNGREICNRTFNIFDGEARYDMVLSYKRTQDVRTDGYSGKSYVCKMKYKPIAGHKKGRKNTERMAKNDDIEIWLAPVGNSNLHTPIRIEVGTWIGSFSAQPAKFKTVAID